MRQGFCCGFCEEWHDSLYRRIWTKYKSSKLFWRILEDNKQDKRENPGKKTVRIAEPAMSTTHILWYSSNATNSFLLSFLPSKSCLFWWILSVNYYVLVFNPIFQWKTKNKASFEGKPQTTCVEFQYAT